MRGWEQLLDGYMAEYSSRGIGAASVARTASVLAHWGTWMRARRPRPRLEQIDADLITRFIATQYAFRTKATVSGVLSTMRGMGDYLVREGVWPSNPARWMRGPKLTPYSRLPRRLDAADLEALWRAAATQRGRYSQHLWVTVLALMYGTGLRRGELERLDVDAWDADESMLLIDGRKTGRERRVPVPDLARRCLEVYLPQRHNRLEAAQCFDERALLVGRDGNRLTAASISNGVHRLASSAGIRFVSLHQFRHSCASDLLEAGVALPDVQRILGHSVIATTVRYTQIADPMRAEAVDRHPINAWLTPREATCSPSTP
jgi:site-specific recombinase XerD